MSSNRIRYLFDTEKGSRLEISVPEKGWIEYTREYHRVYVSKSFPIDLYETYAFKQLFSIKKQWPSIPHNFGFVNHLATVLKDQNFILPVFGVLDKSGSIELTCGNSRFLAHRISKSDPLTLGLVLFSDHEINRGEFVEIYSTKQFNDFYNLNNVDHSINLTQENNAVTVANSLLLHTFYEYEPAGNFLVSGIHRDVLKFWQRFGQVTSSKVPTKLYCRPEHRKFVNPSEIFDIEFVDVAGEWTFSFGKLLSAFKTKDEGIPQEELNIWLFDATEPFDLEWFMPYLKFGDSCVYTENKKIIVFDPSNNCPFKIIGNIVK